MNAYVILRRIVWWKLTDVSEELTACIMSPDGGDSNKL
jgi:hypothetical protein